MRTGRVVRIVGLVIVALAIGLALLPFDHAVPIHGSPGSSGLRSSCSAPFREVLRNHDHDGGFIAYAPLSSPQHLPGHVACAGPARTRLRISVAALLLAALLGAVALFIDRGNGLRRRRPLQLGL